MILAYVNPGGSMKLKHLTDETLLNDMRALVDREKNLLVQILHHLNEIHLRKLYSDKRCGSLFEYCTRELGYDEASAMRRILASRLLLELPEIETSIEQSRLSLSNL